MPEQKRHPSLAGVATAVKKSTHLLIEGSLVSPTYERANGKGKKETAEKITSWSILADVVRKLDRGEPEPEAAPATEAAAPSDAPF